MNLKYSCLITFTFQQNKNDNSHNQNLQYPRAAISKFFNIFTLTLEIDRHSRLSTPTELGLNLSYDIEATNLENATKKCVMLIAKLNLLSSIEEGNEVTPFRLHSVLDSSESSFINMDSLFYGLTPEQIEIFLENHNDAKLLILIEAFQDLGTDRIFDAFPKFVNWLDYNNYNNAPQQKFCVIRTALSHTELHNTELAKSIWPNLKFENNIFVRDQQNQNELLSMMPELLSLVKNRFHQILSNYDDEL